MYNPDKLNHPIPSMLGKKGSNQYLKARSLGLSDPEVSTETRRKLSDAILSRTDEFNKSVGEKISKTVNEKVAEGTWHTSLARNIHIDYNGEDLHGTWELEYVKYLDANSILWVRCKESFDYIFEGKKRKYTPDFYLIDSDEYVEIKGYKTKKDEAKWSQFPIYRKLKVMMKEELQKLGLKIKL